MSILTDKGFEAMSEIINHYTDKDSFSAKQLSDISGQRFVASTLTALANKNLLIKYSTSPVTYSLVPEGDKLFKELKNQSTESKTKTNNDNLHKALKNKDDEFYTYYEDIAAELIHYIPHFVGKTIFLNCNDADEDKSGFWDYLVDNFNVFQLKEIIATSYNMDGNACVKRYDGNNIIKTALNGTGSFSSEESLSLLDEVDLVITNPPFSLFRDLVTLLISKDKKFLLVGNENTFASTEMFPLIKDQKVWTGFNKIKKFKRKEEEDREFGNVCWFTNLSNDKQNEELTLTKSYVPDNYPYYDNYYTAINVDAIADIPKDYDGIMGIPISYLGKYNPKQFEILGLAAGNSKANKLFYDVPHKDSNLERGGCGVVNGVRKYSRVFVKRIK